MTEAHDIKRHTIPLPKYVSIIIIDPHEIVLIGLGRSAELTSVKSF